MTKPSRRWSNSRFTADAGPISSGPFRYDGHGRIGQLRRRSRPQGIQSDCCHQLCGEYASAFTAVPRCGGVRGWRAERATRKLFRWTCNSDEGDPFWSSVTYARARYVMSSRAMPYSGIFCRRCEGHVRRADLLPSGIGEYAMIQAPHRTAGSTGTCDAGILMCFRRGRLRRGIPDLFLHPLWRVVGTRRT